MQDSETPDFKLFVKSLTNQQIDKLQSTILKEMRRRDSDQVTGDVVANSQALQTLRGSGKLLP